MPRSAQTRLTTRDVAPVLFQSSASAANRRSRPSPTVRRSRSTTSHGAVAAAHSIGGGTLFDISAGARVWKSLGVGIAYSHLKNHNDAAVTRASAASGHLRRSRERRPRRQLDLEHSENVVHLQFMWTIPVTRQIPAHGDVRAHRSLPCGRPWQASRRRRTSSIQRRSTTSASGPSA